MARRRDSRTWQWPTLLAITFVGGLAAVLSAPPGMHSGSIWGVGLAAGILLLAPREQRPAAVLAVTVVGGLTFVLAGHPIAVSTGYALGIGAETLVAATVLTAGWSRPARLAGNDDLLRYAAACVLGSIVGSGIFTATVAATSYATPWKVALAVFTAHTVAFSLALGVFVEPVDVAPLFSSRHRAVIWLATIAVALLAFLPTSAPSLAFLVIPSLGWMAFNSRVRESALQLMVIASIVGTLSNEGYGPFQHPYLESSLRGELRNLPLDSFLIACVLVSIPLTMSVALQRRSQAQAVRERNRSARLVESARGIAIIETDEHGVITMFNPGAERILGYRAEEVVGRPTAIFHTEEEIARFAGQIGAGPTYESFVEVMGDRSGNGTSQDIEYICRDGSRRILSTILNTVRDERGALVGYVATADDVTDRLGAHQALEATLAAEREALQRLTDIDQVKDQFVASVSHELRTPITNIVGYLELLTDGVYGAPNEDQARAMARIELNSRRLLTLIDDLLTLSSIETLNQPRELAPVDLVGVLRRAEDVVRPGLLRRELRLHVEVPDEPVVIAGDGGQLERLVINLATNAVKFTLDGGRVTLRLRAAMDGIGPVIEVEDTGIGIPEADQTMLFSRFFRAAQAREAAVPGSGLGLSIAKSIADLHRGRISVTSAPGAGSTFRVEFPTEP
jgi:PAS domain S-box-containing protein